MHAPTYINDHGESAFEVFTVDAPGSGGAHTEYRVAYKDKETGTTRVVPLSFMKGPVTGGAADGLCNEVLLAILIDRMRGFQSGPYPCRENYHAHARLEEALMWLQRRTRDRVSRGVEGKVTP